MPHRLQGLCGLLVSKSASRQLLAGGLDLARAGYGRQMGVAQRRLGGGEAPLVGGLVLVARELRDQCFDGAEFVRDLR